MFSGSIEESGSESPEFYCICISLFFVCFRLRSFLSIKFSERAEIELRYVRLLQDWMDGINPPIDKSDGSGEPRLFNMCHIRANRTGCKDRQPMLATQSLSALIVELILTHLCRRRISVLALLVLLCCNGQYYKG